MSLAPMIFREAKVFNLSIPYLNSFFKGLVSAKIMLNFVISKFNLPFSRRFINKNTRNTGFISHIKAAVFPIFSVSGISKIYPPIIRSISVNMVNTVNRVTASHIKKSQSMRGIKFSIYCYRNIISYFMFMASFIANLFIAIFACFNPCKKPGVWVVVKYGFKVFLCNHLKPLNHRLSILEFTRQRGIESLFQPLSLGAKQPLLYNNIEI